MITRKTVAEELTQEFLTEMKERRVFDDNKKYILDVNKSKMYSLVQGFSVYQLPKVKETEYFKQSGFHTYWLRFLNGLRIFCEEERYDKIYFPSSEQLLEKDLLKKVEKKKERQLTK